MLIKDMRHGKQDLSDYRVVPSFISVWLDYGLELLYNMVGKSVVEEMSIQWATDDKMKHSALLLEHKRPNRNYFLEYLE